MTTFKLTTQEARRAWYADLRSGQYPQGKGVLCTLDEQAKPIGYCCLGVAYETHERQEGQSYRAPDKIKSAVGIPCVLYANRPTDETSFDISTGMLIQPLRSWLGLRSGCGVFHQQNPDVRQYLSERNIDPDLWENLTGLNDGADMSLAQIADFCEFCESHPESGLFVSELDPQS